MSLKLRILNNVSNGSRLVGISRQVADLALQLLHNFALGPADVQFETFCGIRITIWKDNGDRKDRHADPSYLADPETVLCAIDLQALGIVDLVQVMIRHIAGG